MKEARELYTHLISSDDAAAVAILEGVKRRDLHALHYYAQGREEGEERNRILILVTMEAGDRWLSKQAAKARKKAKRIL